MRANKFPHHVGCLLENNTQVWGKSSGPLVVALRCLTDNSRTLLFQCKKVVDACDFSQGRKSRGRRRYCKSSIGGKTIRKRSFDTCRCRVEVPGRSHMRDRRITEISVIVHGLPKIETILHKRLSPAKWEFRTLGLCTCVFDVICNTNYRHTHLMRDANKESVTRPRKVAVYGKAVSIFCTNRE